MKKNLIIATIFVLLAAACYYYFFHGLRASVSKYSSLENETNSLINQESNLNSLHNVFSATTDERQKVNSYLVQSDGTVDFLTNLENLAAFSNLGSETVSVAKEETTPASPIREWLDIQFKTTGNWQNTYYFLSMLETLPYDIDINKVNFHSITQTASTSSSSWQAEYDFRVLKLK